MELREVSEYEQRLGYGPRKGQLKNPEKVTITRGSEDRIAFIVRRRFGNSINEERLTDRGNAQVVKVWAPIVELDVPNKTGGHTRLAFDPLTGVLGDGKWQLSIRDRGAIKSKFDAWRAKNGR